MADLAGLAVTLHDTVAALQQHIEDRAAALAAPVVAAAEAAAAAAVAEEQTGRAFEKQRSDDLLAEMRRQLKAQEQQVESHRAILARHDISPATGQPSPRQRRDTLIGALAQELHAAVNEFHDRQPRHFTSLPEDERQAWIRAAEHAIESHTDRIIEAGRPAWWTTP